MGILDGLLDQILPEPTGQLPGGVQIDPALQRYMQRQQILQGIGRAGDFLMRASMGDSSGGRGSGAGGPLEMMKLQMLLNKQREGQEVRQRERGKLASREALTAGNRYDPKTEILWDTAPAPGQEPSPMTQEQEQSLAAQAYPEAMTAAAAAKYFPAPAEYGAPTTVVGADGKPALVRFPKKGAGAPAEVAGYGPYTKPGEVPAIVQTADAYRSAS